MSDESTVATAFRVRVQFDGACQPLKGGGVATYGFTVDGGGFVHEESGLAAPPWTEASTNNVAEYVAAIRALEWLRDRRWIGEVVLAGDSQLVVRQMDGAYAVRSERLRAYHDQLRRLVPAFSRVRFEWVPRERNARADALSKQALDDVRAEAERLRPRRE